MPHPALRLAALLIVLLAATPAPAQTAEPAAAQALVAARRLCLEKPEFTEDLAKACTAVLDAAQTSPLERAIALNNRSFAQADTARQDLDEALRLAPHIAKLYNNRGLHRMYPDAREALPDFDAAIRLDPHYAVAWNNRGEAYASLKEYDRAIADFDHAIRLAPFYLHPMYNPYEQKAQALEAKGDATAAEVVRRHYFPLFDRVTTREVRTVAVRGARAWEPFLSLADVKTLPRR